MLRYIRKFPENEKGEKKMCKTGLYSCNKDTATMAVFIKND
jgi:hypothetical protein